MNDDSSTAMILGASRASRVVNASAPPSGALGSERSNVTERRVGSETLILRRLDRHQREASTP
jgi:hypothetical protein